MNNLPIIESVSQFVQAFAQIAEEHAQINHFICGNYDDLITESRSKIKYPCLMLEYPDIVFKDNGADYRYRTFESAFVILSNNQKRTKEERLKILDELADIAESVIARLHHESTHFHKFQYEIQNTQLEQIEPIGQDNDMGWRCNVVISRIKPLFFDNQLWT